MLRIAILSVLVAFFIFGDVKANDKELKPLSEVLESEVSDSTLLYAFERCGAMYYAVHEYSKNTPSTTDAMLKQLETLSSSFIDLSTSTISVMRGIETKAAQEVALNVISAMIDLYLARMNDHYINTGEAFDKLVKSDLITCGNLIEAQQTPE